MGLFDHVADFFEDVGREVDKLTGGYITKIAKEYVIPGAIARMSDGEDMKTAVLKEMSPKNVGRGFLKAMTSFVDSWTGNALSNAVKANDPGWEKQIEESAINLDVLERLMKAAQADADDLIAQYNSLRDTSEDIDTRLDDLLSPLGFINSAQVKSVLSSTMAKQASDVDKAVKTARKTYLDEKDRLEKAVKDANTKLAGAQTDYQKAYAEHEDLKNQTLTERI